MADSDVEVAIIGGGAAGIVAGRRLTDARVKCLIVEARDRLGGRGWTVMEAGYPLDLGCGWLHSAENNPWTGVAKKQGRTIDKEEPAWDKDASASALDDDDQDESDEAIEGFEDVLVVAGERGGTDAPASTLLDPRGRWNNAINSVSAWVSGVELDRLSYQDSYNYEDTEVNWRAAEGLGATIVAHAAGVPVSLSSPVQRIDHSGKRLRIETSKGAITADYAIVTLPTNILAAMPDLFAPALPQKTQAAADLPLGLADKLFLALDRPDEFDEDSRIVGRINEAGGSASYHVRPFGRPMIEAYFGGRLAERLERGGEAAFFDFAVGELVAAMGSGFARRLRPIRLHAWGQDPFARGSYSYALPGKVNSRSALATAVDRRLFFAGEACSRYAFSAAHGAWQTAMSAADQILSLRNA